MRLATPATSGCSDRDEDAICVDFGSGGVLDRLDELGVDRVTDVLVTHHHRDSAQGLARAASMRGSAIWVPPVEEELFARAGERWESHAHGERLRPPPGPVLAARVGGGRPATRREYRTRATTAAFDVFALPTPGHTVGSVSYLVESTAARVAFTGDLIYDGGEGLVARRHAVVVQRRRGPGGDDPLAVASSRAARPTVLLPSHGEPIDEPAGAPRRDPRRLHGDDGAAPRRPSAVESRASGSSGRGSR